MNITRYLSSAVLLAFVTVSSTFGQETAFAKTFVDTIFSTDGKTFLTQDVDSRYEVWKADGSLIKRFKDIEADAATISAFVRPLGIEYPAPIVVHKYLRIYEKDTLYTLKVTGETVFTHRFIDRDCRIYAYYLPAKKVGLVQCIGNGNTSNLQYDYLIRPGQLPKPIDLASANVTYGVISPDGKTIADTRLQGAYNIDSDKALWSRGGPARVLNFLDPSSSGFMFGDSGYTFSPDSKFFGSGDNRDAVAIDLSTGESVNKKKGEIKRSYRWLPDMKNTVESGGNFGRRRDSQRPNFITWKDEFGMPFEITKNFVRNAVIGVNEKFDKCTLEQSQIVPGSKYTPKMEPYKWDAPGYDNRTLFVIVAMGNRNFQGIEASFGRTGKTIEPSPQAAQKWNTIIVPNFKAYTPHPDVQFAVFTLATDTFFQLKLLNSDGSPTALFQYKCPY